MMFTDLPRELESEILSRVPAKSLAKLQTTCKRWYTLIRDEKFVKKNLGRSEKEMILLMNFGVYSINIHDPSMELSGKLKRLKDSKDLEISQIFHCDGLILCSTKGNKSLVIWNPCTGETTKIKPRTCYRNDDSYFLGYGDRNSYKILRIGTYYNQQQVLVFEFEIYELSSDSWRVLDDFTDKWIIISCGVSLNGNIYWVASDKEAGFVHVLLSFDFTTERFRSFSLPYHSDDPEDTMSLSVVGEEQVAVLHQNIHTFSLVMNVWLSNKNIHEAKEVSWSKFLVGDFDNFVLLNFTSVMSFLVDKENKLAICCSREQVYDKRCIVYIVGEDRYQQIFKETPNGSSFSWPCLLSYVPSLVQIQRNIPKDKRKSKARRLV